jgi:hypothetical protein
MSAAPSASRCFHPPDSRPARRSGDGGVAALDEPLARQAVDARVEVEVLEDGEIVVEREPLAHIANLAADLLTLGGDVEPEHRGRAARRGQKAAQDADERRLAGAVRSQEAVDHAGAHGQADIVERHEVAEVALHAADHDRIRRPAVGSRTRGMSGRRRVHLGTVMNAAMPARSWSRPSSMPTRVANT